MCQHGGTECHLIAWSKAHLQPLLLRLPAGDELLYVRLVAYCKDCRVGSKPVSAARGACLCDESALSACEHKGGTGRFACAAVRY